MDPKEDEEISIDFGRIKKFFKSDRKEDGRSSDENFKDARSSAKGKEDEDISIDFGKIKSFFKSDKPEPKSKGISADSDEKESDEISLDFSRIKKIFKFDEKETADKEEMPVNWAKVADFFRKYGIVFIALIPVILSIYIRMQAGFLPVTDDWAANSVINGVKSQIRSSIDQQYPNLPDANKNALADTELQKVLSQNKKQVDEQIKATSQYFKAFFQDENGKNYMPDIDPYYWFRYVKNIVDHGHPGDILKEGRPISGGGAISKLTPFDTYQLAPVGRFVTADTFHIYFLAYFYKFLHFFAPSLTIMRSMFYYPVFVAALSVLLIFLIARKIAGATGGFFAALIMAVNGALLGRTLFGHADSDAWVVFFPLVITWLFITTINVKNNLKSALLIISAGFFTGLYTTAWSGWWHIFDFILATISITLLYLVSIKFKGMKSNFRLWLSDSSIRHILIIGIIYLLSAAASATLFSGFAEFRNSFLGPFSFKSIKEPVTPYIWPNVLTTVAELNEGSINDIVKSIGGPFLFFISLMGLIFSIHRTEGLKKFDFAYIIGTAIFYLILFVRFGSGSPPLYNSISVFTLIVWIMLPVMIRIVVAVYKKDTSYDFKLSILLSLWVVSTIFASIKGIRFTLLLAPAFSVAFGVALGKIYAYSSKLLTKELKIHMVIGSSILIVLILLLYVNPVRSAIGSAGSDIPIINDAWYNTLTAINKNSTRNAIITSWWDFGHHFKAIADRPVTFDGTTQTDAAAHWVGRFFMTDNEREALGIIRMLDCAHNNATIALSHINNDLLKSIKIVKEIILLDKEKARQRLLGYGLAKQQADEIVSYTHCEYPEPYVIASEDMIGKSGVWSHFGSWNFERADIWQNARKLPQEKAVEYMAKKFNYTKENANNIYFEMQSITSDSEANSWVAPWPGYGGTVSCSKKSSEIYACSNGLQVNMSNYDIFGLGQQGIVKPKVAAFTTEYGILKKEFNGATLDFGMTIIPKSDNELEVVLSSKELAGSMFTRMFYMRGHGLRYFKLFNHQQGLTGANIYTYTVDWQGKNATIVNEYTDFFKKKANEDVIKESVIKNADSMHLDGNTANKNSS